MTQACGQAGKLKRVTTLMEDQYTQENTPRKGTDFSMLYLAKGWNVKFSFIFLLSVQRPVLKWTMVEGTS